jgi:hypothetical protein
MEKRIGASWCLPEWNARIATDVPACRIFPRRKFRRKAATKTPPGFRAAFGTRRCEQREAIPILRHSGMRPLGADPESSTLHRSGFRVRAKTRAPE